MNHSRSNHNLIGGVVSKECEFYNSYYHDELKKLKKLLNKNKIKKALELIGFTEFNNFECFTCEFINLCYK